MNITLDHRTGETVRRYFDMSRQPFIQENLPQKAQTVEEALQDFEKTLLPGATSFGRILRLDGRYVGDVWCYCMDRHDTPNAMLSFCVFDAACHGRGVATEGVGLFLEEIRAKFQLKTVGAFVFADNIPSLRVLEKNGFLLQEEFEEDGRLSRYYELKW